MRKISGSIQRIYYPDLFTREIRALFGNYTKIRSFRTKDTDYFLFTSFVCVSDYINPGFVFYTFRIAKSLKNYLCK